MAELEELPNLGPTSARLLRAAGIRSLDQIRELGPALTYLAVKQAGGRPSLNLFWAIEGALTNKRWNEVSASRKNRLKRELEDLLK